MAVTIWAIPAMIRRQPAALAKRFNRLFRKDSRSAYPDERDHLAAVEQAASAQRRDRIGPVARHALEGEIGLEPLQPRRRSLGVVGTLVGRLERGKIAQRWEELGRKRACRFRQTRRLGLAQATRQDHGRRRATWRPSRNSAPGARRPYSVSAVP